MQKITHNAREVADVRRLGNVGYLSIVRWAAQIKEEFMRILIDTNNGFCELLDEIEESELDWANNEVQDFFSKKRFAGLKKKFNYKIKKVNQEQ